MKNVPEIKTPLLFKHIQDSLNGWGREVFKDSFKSSTEICPERYFEDYGPDAPIIMIKASHLQDGVWKHVKWYILWGDAFGKARLSVKSGLDKPWREFYFENYFQDFLNPSPQELEDFKLETGMSHILTKDGFTEELTSQGFSEIVATCYEIY